MSAGYANLSDQLQQTRANLKEIGHAIKARAKEFGQFTKNATRAHYNLLGQYTFDVEKELFADEGNSGEAPSISASHIAIFPFPILAWVSSVTWLPFIGNTVQSIPKAFVSAAKLSLFDLPAEKQFSYPTIWGINTGNDTRNSVRRYLYGGLGYLIGGTVGLGVATVVGGCRLVWAGLCHLYNGAVYTIEAIGNGLVDNAMTLGRTFAWFTNLGLPAGDDYQIASDPVFAAAANRHWSKWVIAPGLVLGAVSGVLSMSAVLIARGAWAGLCHLYNGAVYTLEAIENGLADNAMTLGRTFAWFTNLGLPAGDDYQIASDPVFAAAANRHWSKWVIAPGLVLGAVSGVLSMSAVLIARGAWAGLCHLYNGAVYTLEAIENGLADNAMTLGRTFAWFTNLGLPAGDDYQIASDPVFAAAANRHWSKWVIAPGLVLGAVSGVLSMSAVLIARGAWAGLCHLYNGAVYTLEAIENGLADNAMTLGRTFAWFTNLGLPAGDDYQIASDPVFAAAANRHWSKWVITPGLVLGAVSGVLSMSAVLIARGAWAGLCHLYNGAVYTLEAIENGLADNAMTLGRTFAWFTNLGLPAGDDYQIASDPVFAAAANRHWSKWVIAPGLVLGAVSGVLSMSAVLIARGAWAGLCHLYNGAVYTLEAIENGLADNAMTLGRTFAWFTNLGLPAGDDYQIASDPVFAAAANRHWSKWVIAPGLVLGAVSGVLSMSAVLIARGAWAGLCHLYNGAVYTLEAIENGLADNAMTLGRTFAWFTNLGLPAGDDYQIASDPVFAAAANRHWSKWVIAPGLVLGAVSGVLSMSAVLIARGAWAGLCHLYNGAVYTLEAIENGLADNAMTLGRTFAWFTNLGLPAGDDYQIASDPVFAAAANRHWSKWVIAPGLVLGAVSGVLSMSAVLIARGAWAGLCHLYNGAVYTLEAIENGLADNAMTLGRTFAWFTNLGLPAGDDYQIASDPVFAAAANRHWSKWVIAPGLVLGAVSGVLSMSAVLLARGAWIGIKENANTLGRTFAWFTNQAWTGNPIVTEPVFQVEGRHSALKFLTIPGLIVGAGAGLISMVAIFIGRGFIAGFDILKQVARGIRAGLVDNAYTAARTFAKLANITLSAENQIDEVRFAAAEGRHPVLKYTSIPGLLIGGVSGLVAMCAIGSVRLVWGLLKNTVISWCTLSGSAINGAMERLWFQGLAGDTRSDGQKKLGVLGYAVACLTTIPCAVGIYAIRSLPNVSVVLFGLACVAATPLVSVCKLISKGTGLGGRRFNNDEINDAYLQKFKNLYSSLTPSGRLNVGFNVVENGTGDKSYWSFVRKCFTGNFSCRTEQLLDGFLAQYRAWKQNHQGEFVAAREFKPIIDGLKEKYEIGCFDDADSITAIHDDIDEIARFIIAYLETEIEPGSSKRIEGLYVQKNQRPWTDFFRGYKEEAKAEMPRSPSPALGIG